MLYLGEACLLTIKEMRQVEETIRRLTGSTGVQGSHGEESRPSPVDPQVDPGTRDECSHSSLLHILAREFILCLPVGR